VGLVSSPPAQVTSGRALFQGRDLFSLSSAELRELRARKIGMIFQDPGTNLNPLLTIEQQLTDAIMVRMGYGSTLTLSALGALSPHVRRQRRVARERAVALLNRVGIPDADVRLNSYPGEFSGGMQQRTLTAMAVCGEPELLVADEPTTALDVSVQSQVLNMVLELVKELGLSVLWITHDLGVVARICNRVSVMYAGNIVEEGPVRPVFKDPKHPYTLGLMQSTPTRGRDAGELYAIPGSVPNLIDPPPGCRFHTRCPHAMPICRREPFPPLVTVGQGHRAACHLFSGGRDRGSARQDIANG
jgi:oligopeptide/dipeptide ABC transporter ATP-binding protein